MTTWLDERVAEIRGGRTPGDEGSLWMIFLDAPRGRPLLASVVDNAMAHMEEVMKRNLAWIFDSTGSTAILLAVIRSDGQPRLADRQLWPDLRSRVKDVELVDLLVIGDAGYCSAAGSSHARTSRARRPSVRPMPPTPAQLPRTQRGRP